MRVLQIIMFVTILAVPVHANETKFIDSWNNYDEQITGHDDSRLHYRKKIALSFDSLQEYQGKIAKPEGINEEIGKVLVLYSQKNMAILLVTPQNTMQNGNFLNEEYIKAIKKCAEDKSWIVVLPQNEWSEIDLNPFCTVQYDEDQITIELYWPEPASRPLIDIVTNSLSCVPHQLYGWDRRSHKYVLESRKCTGLRPVESYTAINWRLLH